MWCADGKTREGNQEDRGSTKELGKLFLGSPDSARSKHCERALEREDSLRQALTAESHSSY